MHGEVFIFTNMIIFALVRPKCHNFIDRPILAGMSDAGDVFSHSKGIKICWPEVKTGIAAIRVVRDVPGAIISLCVFEGPHGANGEDGVEFQAD